MARGGVVPSGCDLWVANVVRAERGAAVVVEALRDEGDGDIVAYFCNGHVDKKEFLCEVENEYGDLDDDEKADPQHLLARWVPRPQWGYGARELTFCKDSGQGVFPVTYLEAK